jgi:hypothetical protein
VPASGKVMKLDLGSNEMNISSDMANNQLHPVEPLQFPGLSSAARGACRVQLRSL